MTPPKKKSQRIRIRRGLWVLTSKSDEYPLGFFLGNDYSVYIDRAMAHSVLYFIETTLDGGKLLKATWPYRGFRNSRMLKYAPGEHIVDYFGHLCFSGWPVWMRRIWVDDDQAKQICHIFTARLKQSD